MLRGLMDLTNPSMVKFASKHSNVLRPREFDVHIQEAVESIIRPGMLRKAQKGAATAGYWPLKVLDNTAAYGTWLGAYRRGKKIGLGGEELYRYADDVVVRTQGSSIPSDVTRIQQSDLGKLATMFQTFVINEWNLVSRDILGYKSAVTPTRERVRKAINLLMAGTAANIVMEDVAGMPSPLPTPIKAYRKFGGGVTGGLHAGRELLTMVPGIGGSFFSSLGTGTPGGPLGRFAVEAAKQTTEPNRRALFLGLQALGVPGTVQLERLTGVPGRFTLPEALLGKQYEPPPPARRRRKSREQIRKGESYMLDPILDALPEID